jgi:hypothetical protein
MTEADRRVAEENLTAIRSADLLKIAVPQRFGGLETDIRTTLEVSRELGSTAWVTTPSNSASRVLGAGSSSFMEQNPLQRIWRDIGIAARHAVSYPRSGQRSTVARC